MGLSFCCAKCQSILHEPTGSIGEINFSLCGVTWKWHFLRNEQRLTRTILNNSLKVYENWNFFTKNHETNDHFISISCIDSVTKITKKFAEWKIALAIYHMASQKCRHILMESAKFNRFWMYRTAIPGNYVKMNRNLCKIS